MREYIEAQKGYMLTNGEVYGKQIYLAQGLDKTDFKEITEEEYEAVLQTESQTVWS